MQKSRAYEEEADLNIVRNIGGSYKKVVNEFPFSLHAQNLTEWVKDMEISPKSIKSIEENTQNTA